MNTDINSKLIHDYHKRTQTPLLEAKVILEDMEAILLKRALRAITELSDSCKPLYDPIEGDFEFRDIIIKAKKVSEYRVMKRYGLG